jgi:hypothetical protein
MMKVGMSRTHAALTTFAIALLLPATAAGKGPDLSQSALAGLTEVYVMVWDLDPGVQEDGLDPASIRGRIVPMLERAGLRILETSEYAYALHSGSPLPPALVIDVHALRSSEGAYVVNIELELWETALKVADPGVGIAQATTWRAPSLLMTIGKDKISAILDRIQEMVDRFLNDYWTANFSERLAAGAPTAP